MATRTTRTAEQRYRRARSIEGGDFEQYRVHPALLADGYDAARSHMSKGPFDWLFAKRGHLLVVGARLTGVGAVSPGFSHAELDALWRLSVRLSVPGMDVHALVATAEHAPTWRAKTRDFGPCRCSAVMPHDVEPTRFLRLTAPPVAGRGRRPAWEPWTPDFALDAA